MTTAPSTLAPSGAAGPVATPRRRSSGRDWITMLRRNLLHILRYPGLTVFVIGGPILFLLLSVYVFGGTLGAGLPADVLALTGGETGRAAYLAFVAPTILVMAIAGAASGVAISVSMDVTRGIASRFRTMPVSRGSIIGGHVLAVTIEAVVTSALVLGLALLMGYRPAASPADWLALLGVVVLLSFSIVWLGAAFGLVAKSVETASNLPMILLLLPFLGSGFVPVDSMPGWLAWFAEHQPFTPFIDTVRGLLSGSVQTSDVVATLIWAVVIGVGSYVWALALFRRERAV
jgi:ABC-2 type transport system permease protein